MLLDGLRDRSSYRCYEYNLNGLMANLCSYGAVSDTGNRSLMRSSDYRRDSCCVIRGTRTERAPPGILLVMFV